MIKAADQWRGHSRLAHVCLVSFVCVVCACQEVPLDIHQAASEDNAAAGREMPAADPEINAVEEDEAAW